TSARGPASAMAWRRSRPGRSSSRPTIPILRAARWRPETAGSARSGPKRPEAARSGRVGHTPAMELRQLRFFVTVVAYGSMNRAAVELGVVPSALSQGISRLEGELATRLLQRSPRGVTPTDAGLA